MGKIASRILIASSNITQVVTKLLFPELSIVRICDTFNEPQSVTNSLSSIKDNELLPGFW